MAAVHAAIAIVVAIILIIRFKVDPVIALVISCLYLGLAAGLGPDGTIAAITGGFGEIMAEVGLLIGFGVLIGALLHSMGTFADLVDVLARRVGRKLPYAMAGALATIFPSIYVDVQVVLAAPMARQSAATVHPKLGLPWLAGALGIGIFAGYVFTVPGLAAVAVAGLLEVPLGLYLLFGAPIGLITALVTTVLFRQLLRGRYWREDTDLATVSSPDDASTGSTDEADPEAPSAPAGSAARLPLVVRLLPILVPLILIATGAITDLAGLGNPVTAFLGDATIALFLGLVIAFVMVRSSVSADHTGTIVVSGLRTTGEILLITGIGGSLGTVITESGLGDILKGLFSADAQTPILVSIILSWVIAAVLHFAIGSVSVAAITAAGIIAPVAGAIGVDPLVIALSIASGAMFALHVNSNFFWMFSSLLGLSTKGALKTLTAATSLGAVVSLPLVLVVALVTAAT